MVGGSTYLLCLTIYLLAIPIAIECIGMGLGLVESVTIMVTLMSPLAWPMAEIFGIPVILGLEMVKSE